MFFNEYIASTDLIAIVALVILGVIALVRRQRVWLIAMTVVLVIWAATRIFHLF